MRINRFVAEATGKSRRQADKLIASGQVTLNGHPVELGQLVKDNDTVSVKGETVSLPKHYTTIMFHKPAGYITSRHQQNDTPTIYKLLPDKLGTLKPIGRLDKGSRGLLLLTNDGQLALRLSHPRYQKTKIYEIELDRALTNKDKTRIEQGVRVDDYTSRLSLQKIEPTHWRISMTQGRNRQIRKTFATLGYQVTDLLRTQFGPYSLGNLPEGQYKAVDTEIT